ncbi:uncharacterized protein LOC127281036 [Leptopilina boulardi]|uniref:uncharacterized protein LOC127281036 n=1 Tax=Leptopilina boulardi TaxID=63433 RepID=UPI0021F55460|nr:uncharacterized protein LOC127281036 [Leptopilina boulardi]
MQFLHDRSEDVEVDSSISAKASGFYNYLESFECVFFLTTMIEIFDHIEVLNKELQNSELCVIESYQKIEAVTDFLIDSRDSKFVKIWQKCLETVDKLELEEPKLPRQRKIPKRIQTSTSEDHRFNTPEDFYRKLYFEVFDQIIVSLKSRFENDSAGFFKSLEQFVIGEPVNVDEIVDFYKDDFDKERLINDREMFLQLLKRKNVQVKNLREVVDFLKQNEWSRGLILEFVRFVKLLMTIPGSSCSNERSFSTLRRLKTYLRSMMRQDRLNNIALIHIYSEMADKLDLEKLLDTFISQNSKRSAVFALSR